MHYFTWKLELISNIFWMIVDIFITRNQICKFSHELWINVGPEESSKFHENSWNPWNWKEYSASYLKGKFWQLRQKFEKSQLSTYSLEKPILLNFVILSKIYCSRLSEETFLFLTWPRPLGIYKYPSALKIHI